MNAPLDTLAGRSAAGSWSDPVEMSDLMALARADGPCASLVLPVHRHGRATTTDARRLAQMAKHLVPGLRAAGFDDRSAHKFVAPLRALADDGDFWQHQSRSLAVFRTPRWTWRWRLDHDLPEEASLAATPRIRVLLASLGTLRFHVLAVSQNHVRVLSVSGNRVERRRLPELPRSVAEALRFEHHDKNLGFHSTGGQLHRHGTGIGREVEKEKVRRFLHDLDHAFEAAARDWREPIVLACTDECAAMYRGLTRLVRLAPEHVPGSPDRISDEELARLATPMAARCAPSVVVDGRDMALFGEMDGTGRVIRGLADTFDALARGSVEVLFVTDDAPVWGTVSAGVIVESQLPDPTVLDEDLPGSCVVAALEQGARIHLVRGGVLGDGVRVAALTRY